VKTYIHAFAMCQSMFCAIPFPCHIWDEKARGKMLLFLPFVGLEIGILWVVLDWLCRWLALPQLVTGLIMCVWPMASAGYLHLDGFMDVTDAVKSCRNLERRREILKDSRVGAFAVIGVVLLVLAQFALFASAPAQADSRILIWIPGISRCCSALAVLGLKPMTTSQYAASRPSRGHLMLLLALTVCFTGAGFLLCGKYGFALLGCMAGYGLALRRAYRSLEGMNGDISGYCLTIGELCAVAVYALI